MPGDRTRRRDLALSIWDGILINASASFLVEPVHLREEEQARLDLIAEAARHASVTDAPMMARLAAACAALGEAHGGRLDPAGSARWSRARLEAGAAVAATLNWRTLQLLQKLERDEG